MRIHFHAGLIVAIASVLGFLYFSGVFYEYFYFNYESNRIVVKSNCRSVHHLKASAHFRDQKTLQVVLALVNEHGLAETVSRDCQYIEVMSDESMKYLIATKYTNGARDAEELSIDKTDLYPKDGLNDKFNYSARINGTQNLDTVLSFNVEPEMIAKTYAMKLLRLEIYYYDDSKPEKPPSAEFVLRLDPRELAKTSSGSQAPYDSLAWRSNFQGPEYKFYSEPPLKSNDPNAFSSISANLEYSSALGERVESAFLTGLAALFSVGVALMVQAVCDRFGEKRRSGGIKL